MGVKFNRRSLLTGILMTASLFWVPFRAKRMAYVVASREIVMEGEEKGWRLVSTTVTGGEEYEVDFYGVYLHSDRLDPDETYVFLAYVNPSELSVCMPSLCVKGSLDPSFL